MEAEQDRNGEVPPKGIEVSDGVARMSERRFAAWTVFVFACGVAFALVTSYDVVREKVRHSAAVDEAKAFCAALEDCDRSEESLVAMYRAGEAYFTQVLRSEAHNRYAPMRLPTFPEVTSSMAESCAASLWADIEKGRKRDEGYVPDEKTLKRMRNAKDILAYLVSDCDRRAKKAKDAKDGKGKDKGKGGSR